MNFRSSVRIRLLSILFGTLLVLPWAGCTKKEDKSQSAASNTLLTALPTDTTGFYSFRTDLEGYKKLRAQNWSSWSESVLKDIDQHVTAMDPAHGQAIGNLFAVVKESGLIPASPEQQDGIKEGLLFISADPEKQEISGALYLNTIPSVNCKELTQKMIPHLEQTKMKVIQETKDSLSILTISDAANSGEARTVYLVAGTDRMALATHREKAEKLFSHPVDTGYTQIAASPAYQQITAEVTQSGEQFGFGYIDLTKLKHFAEKMPNVPDPEGIKELPFSAAALSQSINDGVATTFAVSMAPINDQQKLLISNLERMPENTLSDRAPVDAVLFFGLDGQLLKTVQEGAISELSPEQRKEAAPWLTFVESLKGLSLAFRQSAGDSPFPDLILSAQSGEAPKMAEFLKTEINAILTAQFQMSRWLEKDIQGAKVSYMLTPLGIGIYIGSVKDMVIVASTESAINAALLSATDANKALPSTLQANNRAVLTASSSLTNGYADFAKLAELIESVQGSLSLFTGGANAMNAAQIQGIKRMGIGAASLKISKGFLKGEIHVKPQEKELSR